MIINAENLILGRLASYVAKKAIEGDTVDVVNAEKAVIVGKKEDILKKYKHKRERGDPLHGPYFPRQPESMVKRSIRNMLPYKKPRGKEAFKRIKCYVGIPEELKDKEMKTLKSAQMSEKVIKYVSISDISKYLGGK